VDVLYVMSRYGIEQEYTLLQKDINWPLGWPVGGFPGPQVWNLFQYLFFFFLIRETPPPESALCGLRWTSKTPAVPGSYKRCTSWLELETCCENLFQYLLTCLSDMLPGCLLTSSVNIYTFAGSILLFCRGWQILRPWHCWCPLQGMLVCWY
jgi:hypothetical protein